MRLLKGCVLLVGLLAFSAFTCTIGGGGAYQESYYLAIPLIWQECPLCCAAASIQMLQAYCGRPLIPQTQILQLIGGAPSSGAGWEQIASGVNQLTCYTGATVSYYGSGDPFQLELAVTEQIAAIVSDEPHLPVLPQVRFNHVGVLAGGSAYYDGWNWCWNSVYFLDPLFGEQWLPADLWLSSQWFNVDGALIQIVPVAVRPPVATTLWEEYHSRVRLWDGEGFEPPFENL